MNEWEMAKNNTCLQVVTGSHLYGFNSQESDTDYQGIFMPPKEYVYGLHACDQVIYNNKDNGHDETIFNFLKFIRLARNNNPNIISILYTPQNRICYKNELGDMLLENANMFLSKKCYHSYKGYVHQTKSKLLTKNPLVDSKRKVLVDKYGYDTKYLCHCIRLLWECLGILVDKKITYPLANAKQLLDVRNGKYSLDWGLTECVRLENLVDEAYVRSDLQHSPDDNGIEKLQMEILEKFWSQQCK